MAAKYLCNIWNEFNPPCQNLTTKGSRSDLLKKAKARFFVGKNLQSFLCGSEGPAKEFEIEEFKKVARSTLTVFQIQAFQAFQLPLAVQFKYLCNYDDWADDGSVDAFSIKWWVWFHF